MMLRVLCSLFVAPSHHTWTPRTILSGAKCPRHHLVLGPPDTEAPARHTSGPRTFGLHVRVINRATDEYFKNDNHEQVPFSGGCSSICPLRLDVACFDQRPPKKALNMLDHD